MATVLDRGTTAPAGTRSPRGVAGWMLACVLVGGVAAVDPWGFAPFGPVKTTVICAGILAAAAALRGRTLVLDRRMTLCWAALLGWLLIAALGAVDPLHAWLGTPERRLGWLAWGLFAIAWGCGRAVGEERDLRGLLRAAALAAGALGLYAAAELAGLAPAPGTFAGGRLGGPYGQPAYLGAAGVLLTPIAVGLAADVRERIAWRVAAAGSGGLGAVAILGSQTRAAWVGIAVACVPLAARTWRAARRRPAAGALLLAAAALVLSLTPVGGRMASIVDLDGTAQGRVDEWRTAAAVLAQAPLLGHGPEGYRVAFPESVDRAYARAHGRDVIPDRAHNGVLDVAVSGGAPAGGLYLALLVLVSMAAWRAARGGDVLLAGAGVGVLAYAAQQQLLFPVVEVDPLFWVLAGAVGVHAGASSRDDRTFHVPAALARGLALAAVAVVLLGGLEVAADRSLQRAAARPAAHVAALAEADRAVALRPDSVRARYVAAGIAARGPTLTDVDAALDRIEAAQAVAARDPAVRTEHARLLLERAQRSGLATDLDRALEALEDLVTGDPAHPAHRVRLGAALVLAGDLAGADVHLAAAEDLAPGRAAHSIERARVALLRGDLTTARSAVERARTADPTHPRLAQILAEVDGR